MLEVLCPEIVGVVAEGIHGGDVRADNGRGLAASLPLIRVAPQNLLIQIHGRPVLGSSRCTRV